MNERVTKEVAFASLANEVNIPIDYAAHDFRFTRKWFKQRNQSTFSTFLPKKFPPDKPLRMIQIGVFEAMDLVWQFQNTLCHPNSLAVGIDPWGATRKLDQDKMDAVHKAAVHNLNPWRRKVELIRGFSQDVLLDAITAPLHGIPAGFWDLVVIDGDHNKAAVLRDAVFSLRLVRVGGWLLFDDVRNRVAKKNHVVHGIEQFLKTNGDKVKRVWAHRYCDCYERVK